MLLDEFSKCVNRQERIFVLIEVTYPKKNDPRIDPGFRKRDLFFDVSESRRHAEHLDNLVSFPYLPTIDPVISQIQRAEKIGLDILVCTCLQNFLYSLKRLFSPMLNENFQSGIL